MRALLLLWLLATASVAGAQSTVFDRMERRSELLGWEGVGRLDTGTGFCSGTLIAPDLVLTAAHCVLDTRTGREAPTEPMRFRAGYHHGTQVAVRGVAQAVVPDGYRASRQSGDVSDRIRNDLALLRLTSPIYGAEADPFDLHRTPPRETSVSVVSYGRGRSEVLSREPECQMDAVYGGGIYAFDCDVTFGSSGAPVFVREDGHMRIFSVVSSMVEMDDGRRRAFGMALPDRVAALRRQLVAAEGRTPVSTGARRVTIGERSRTGARFVRPGGS